MTDILLALGLLGGGCLGYALGAHPALLARVYRALRRRHRITAPAAHPAACNHGHGDSGHHESHDPGEAHEGHGHPAYQDRDGQDAQHIIDYLYPLAVAFFAGFVLSTLVPDALSHSGAGMAWFAAGVAVMGILSRKIFKRDPCCEGGHDHRGFGAISMLAMSVCSLNDGLLLGLLSPEWWSGLNAGMFIHKITSSFAIAQVLRQTRFRGAPLYVFGAFATVISPLAFLAARVFSIRESETAELAMAFSAGILAWVSVGSLLPHARAIMLRRPRAAIGFFLALGVSISLGFWHTRMHYHAEGGAVDPEHPAHPAHRMHPMEKAP